jgi:cytochrome c oxidase subunit 4
MSADTTHSDSAAHPAPVEHTHPGAAVYLRIAVILFMLTVLEVGIFYVPAFHPILVPALLILSAIKFTLVVLFYMHLKMDSKIFTMIFGGPLLLATAVMIGLCFLFGVFVIR